MGGLPEADHACVADAFEERSQIDRLDVVDALDALVQEMGHRLGTARGAVREHDRVRRLGRPALRPDERHEADRAEVLADEAPVVLLAQAQQALRLPPLSDRQHEAPPGRELLHERIGHRGCARGNGDRLVGSLLRPAKRPVSLQDLDVVVTEARQPPTRPLGERCVAFDREHPPRDPREDGRRVTRTGADLEDPVARYEFERLGHQRDDVGLGDGLAALDRQRAVAVGEFRHFRRQERLPRHRSHRPQDALVAHTAGRDLGADHLRALVVPRFARSRVHDSASPGVHRVALRRLAVASAVPTAAPYRSPLQLNSFPTLRITPGRPRSDGNTQTPAWGRFLGS